MAKVTALSRRSKFRKKAAFLTTMGTQSQFEFEGDFSRKLVGKLLDAQLATEGGALLSRATDCNIGPLRRMECCFSNPATHSALRMSFPDAGAAQPQRPSSSTTHASHGLSEPDACQVSRDFLFRTSRNLPSPSDAHPKDSVVEFSIVPHLAELFFVS